MHPGDLLVLYTDGLIERRSENLDEGLQRLADVAVAVRDDSVQDVADRLIATLVGTTAATTSHSSSSASTSRKPPLQRSAAVLTRSVP